MSPPLSPGIGDRPTEPCLWGEGEITGLQLTKFLSQVRPAKFLDDCRSSVIINLSP